MLRVLKYNIYPVLGYIGPKRPPKSGFLWANIVQYTLQFIIRSISLEKYRILLDWKTNDEILQCMLTLIRKVVTGSLDSTLGDQL